MHKTNRNVTYEEFEIHIRWYVGINLLGFVLMKIQIQNNLKMSYFVYCKETLYRYKNLHSIYSAQNAMQFSNYYFIQKIQISNP